MTLDDRPRERLVFFGKMSLEEHQRLCESEDAEAIGHVENPYVGETFTAPSARRGAQGLQAAFVYIHLSIPGPESLPG